ncbi:S-layer homology domain-containing protein [Thermoproteota archaeon]
MKKLASLILFCMITAPLIGATIKDIPQSDPNYPAVKNCVNSGYLPLFNDQTFRGNKTISRKELAVVIDKLITDIDKQGMNLNKDQVQELVNLAKEYKLYIENIETYQNSSDSRFSTINDEQITLHNDISEIHSDVNQVKDQGMWVWLGIAAATVIGVLF